MFTIPQDKKRDDLFQQPNFFLRCYACLPKEKTPADSNYSARFIENFTEKIARVSAFTYPRDVMSFRVKYPGHSTTSQNMCDYRENDEFVRLNIIPNFIPKQEDFVRQTAEEQVQAQEAEIEALI